MASQFDPHAPTGRPPRRFGWWLAGRASRTEYWLYIALIIALSVGISFIPNLEAGGSGLWVATMFMQIRRLHDIGRTGWWAVAANVAPVVLMLPFLVSLDTALLVGVLAEVVLVILIGALKGDPRENRFGAPPLRTWKYMLTGR